MIAMVTMDVNNNSSRQNSNYILQDKIFALSYLDETHVPVGSPYAMNV